MMTYFEIRNLSVFPVNYKTQLIMFFDLVLFSQYTCESKCIYTFGYTYFVKQDICPKQAGMKLSKQAYSLCDPQAKNRPPATVFTILHNPSHLCCLIGTVK